MTTTPPLRPATLTYSKTPPALPPADRSHKGALVVTVLSAYDLSREEQPLAVSLEVGGARVSTGPPSARHKDRNSYRFISSQVLRVDAPLSILYNETASLTLEYPNRQDNLTALLVCKSIHIHETQWLILNLEPPNKSGSSTSMTTTTTEEEEVVIPTLRLQVRLEGPYRTEIAALVSACNAWFRTVDSATDAFGSITKKLPTTSNMPSGKFLLVPTVPILTAVVVLSPILVGVLIVGLPVFLPIIVALFGILLGVLAVGGILVASTKRGRTSLASTCSPMYHTLLSTPSGQRLVYETGPRPTPVSIARSLLPTDLWGKLAVSLCIDAVGSATYLLPVVGEVMDVVWAPLQTILIMAMYDSVSPNLKYISFVEEILPLTDVIPSATIGWLQEFGPQLVGPVLGGASAGNGENSGTDTTAAAMQIMASLTKQVANNSSSSMNGSASRTNGSAIPTTARSS